jgi:hypothetical protein
MPSNYLNFIATRLTSIPEEIHRRDGESTKLDPLRASVYRPSSSSSFDSTASATSIAFMRNWVYDEAKSSSFMPKVPARSTNECISNDTPPKAPRRRLSDDFGAEYDIPAIVKTDALLSNQLPLSIPYEMILDDATCLCFT